MTRANRVYVYVCVYGGSHEFQEMWVECVSYGDVKSKIFVGYLKRQEKGQDEREEEGEKGMLMITSGDENNQARTGAGCLGSTSSMARSTYQYKVSQS